MQFSIDLMGYVAAFCTTAAFIPQVVLVWRQRSAKGISLAMYLSFCFGVFLWLCYGIIIQAWPLAINNGITLALASSVLVMKWRFDRVPPASKPEQTRSVHA
ncbi:SemiSWEET transporter [Herbaspirillum sp. SJZ107]|uniref:SemiSWEET transporter n=1 Tax=Herbaspirillum sp. SJZ107 TaxID=2572881 RepID=UPI00114FE7F7|nr:SemiSWEET transporter [Herbaspirillum sp. SJZ107]TQK06942.1 MtN3 and saliva related transmembrane protein [Herbaspirillum sp. SJZ107]